MPAWFVQFFFWSFCRREVCGLDNGGGSVFKDYWNSSLKVGRSIKSAIFFWKKVEFNPKVALVTWKVVLAILPNFLNRNPKDSRSVPKSSKSFVSSGNLTLRMFHWTRRMPYWRTWSFLANQSFLRKTNTKYKVVPPSKKFCQIFPLVAWILFLTPMSKTSATNLEFLHSKWKKNVKLIFF